MTDLSTPFAATTVLNEGTTKPAVKVTPPSSCSYFEAFKRKGRIRRRSIAKRHFPRIASPASVIWQPTADHTCVLIRPRCDEQPPKARLQLSPSKQLLSPRKMTTTTASKKAAAQQQPKAVLLQQVASPKKPAARPEETSASSRSLLLQDDDDDDAKDRSFLLAASPKATAPRAALKSTKDGVIHGSGLLVKPKPKSKTVPKPAAPKKRKVYARRKPKASSKATTKATSKATPKKTPKQKKARPATGAEKYSANVAMAIAATKAAEKAVKILAQQKKKNKPFTVRKADLSDKEGRQVVANRNDVLFGRGNGTAAHPGNAQFRAFCWKMRGEYQEAAT